MFEYDFLLLCQCHHFLSGLLSAVTKRIPCFIGSDLVFNEPSDLILNYHKQRFRYIVINQKINDKFKSIICAHELGHDRLHQHFARNTAIREFSLFDMSSKPEREANLFATELLIPDNTIMDFAKQEYPYEFIAAKLDIPVELVDFKSQILKNKGYDINPIQIANSEFLRK